jgi:branched-chain amino acid aminotransferase
VATKSFGTDFGERMAVSRFGDGAWSPAEIVDTGAFTLHPATHVFHYGSACFEGMKAHRGGDGRVRVFRLDAHVARMRSSAAGVCLPVPDPEALAGMIVDTVSANIDAVPQAPGALYLRPTLIGTDVNVGAAATASSSALLFVLSCPVGEYFSGGLKLVVETQLPRTTPHFGRIKTGANYVMALPLLLDAKEKHGAHQVLFAPAGKVQETGAANVVLILGQRVVTPALTDNFLHGVTRDSVLRLAEDHGYTVEERDVRVDELMGWMPEGEVALTGTAALLAPVDELVRPDIGQTSRAGGHDHARRLLSALQALHAGEADDPRGWLTEVGP